MNIHKLTYTILLAGLCAVPAAAQTAPKTKTPTPANAAAASNQELNAQVDTIVMRAQAGCSCCCCNSGFSVPQQTQQDIDRETQQAFVLNKQDFANEDTPSFPAQQERRCSNTCNCGTKTADKPANTATTTAEKKAKTLVSPEKKGNKNAAPRTSAAKKQPREVTQPTWARKVG